MHLFLNESTNFPCFLLARPDRPDGLTFTSGDISVALNCRSIVFLVLRSPLLARLFFACRTRSRSLYVIAFESVPIYSTFAVILVLPRVFHHLFNLSFPYSFTCLFFRLLSFHFIIFLFFRFCFHTRSELSITLLSSYVSIFRLFSLAAVCHYSFFSPLLSFRH